MLHRLVHSRLSAVVAVRQAHADRLFSQLARRVMRQWDGRESLHETWIFASAAAAVGAAHELFRLGKEEVFAAVITGEVQATGPLRGVLSERARNVCKTVGRPGVYTCSVTHGLAEDSLPPDMWLSDIGRIEIESGGVEHLSVLCLGMEEPDVNAITARGSRIPKPRRSFVGRQGEVQELIDLIFDRFIVTIAGLPGMGKSSVAAEVARAIAVEYSEGIFWIDVANCKTRAELIRKLEEATRPAGSRLAGPLPALSARLNGMEALIVFDNCEVLIEEVRAIAQTLVDDTTKLGILATSTIALQLPREHVYALPSLSMPAREGEIESLRLLNSDALALFAERAQAAQPAFTLSPGNVHAVADICRSLGGSPLAIEIFASKLGGRSLATLGRQTAKALTLRGDGGLRPHQRSLKEAYSHAFDHVPPAERELLLKLSLFDGDFSFDEAAELWTEEADDSAFGDSLNCLVSASLLAYNHDLCLYSINPVLRTFIGELVDADADQSVRASFCSRMFDIGQQAKRHFDAKNEAAAVEVLNRSYSHIESALRMAFHIPLLHPRVNGMLTVLPRYWLLTNRLIDIDGLLEEALVHVQMKATERPTYLNVIGASCLAQQDFERAEKCFLESVDLLENSAHVKGLHAAYGNLAYLYKERGEFERSVDYNARALAIAREEGERVRILNVLVNSADSIMRWLQQEVTPSNSEELLNQARTIGDEVELMLLDGVEPLWMQCLYHLRGEVAYSEGDFDQAEHFFVLAALTCDEAGILHEAVQAMDRLSEIEFMRGEYERAAKLLGCALRLRVESGRFRSDREERHVNQMLQALAEKLGSSLSDEYLKYGASAAISDLCVLRKVIL